MTSCDVLITRWFDVLIRKAVFSFWKNLLFDAYVFQGEMKLEILKIYRMTFVWYATA